MKIGILTFHYPWNYGAVLQAYASVQILREMGHEPVVLDYRNPTVERNGRVLYWDANRFRHEKLYVLKFLPLCVRRAARAIRFRWFRRHYLPLRPFGEKVDAYLVGSDQVWNAGQTGGMDPVYTGLKFPKGVPVISWVASAGPSTLSEESVAAIKERFTAISVREKPLQDLFPGSTLLPDPTLMAPPQTWEPLLKRARRRRYILAYPMIREHEVLDSARWKAAKMQLPLKILSNRPSLYLRRHIAASPRKVLTMLHGAEHIVTSSFHGAVFAGVFQRPLTLVSDPLDPRFDALKADPEQGLADAKQFLEKALKG